MENSSVNLDFLQNTSLPTVHVCLPILFWSYLTCLQDQLRNISADLNDTINGPEYFQSLADVNASKFVIQIWL